MKLEFNYAYLLEVLTGVSPVLKNTNIDVSDKNIIFSYKDEVLSVYAFSTIITFRNELDKTLVNIYSDDDFLFQLPFVKLLDYLNTFNKVDSRPTLVGIEFLNEYEYKVTVTEEVENHLGEVEISAVDVAFNTRSVNARVLNNLEMLRSVDSNEVMFDSLTDIEKQRWVAMIDDLLPYVPERLGKGSVLSFKDGNVEVNLQYMFVNFKNVVKAQFETGALTHPALQVIRDVMRSEETVTYYIDAPQSVIVLSYGNSTVGIRYEARPIATRNHIEGMESLNSFVISRKYLISLIERLNVIGGADSVNFEIDVENEEVLCSTPTYSSKVGILDVVSTPVTGLANGLQGLKLSIQLNLLKETIFGSNSEYPDDMTFTIFGVKNYLIIKVSDSTEFWNIVFKTN